MIVVLRYAWKISFSRQAGSPDLTFSFPDPAHPPPAFSIVPTDREPGASTSISFWILKIQRDMQNQIIAVWLWATVKVFSLNSEINPAIEIVMASVGSVWIICAWTATLDSSSLATQQWTIVFWLGVLSNFSLHTIGEVLLKATSSDGRMCIRFLILCLTLWY